MVAVAEVGEAGDGRQALELARLRRPDVVLISTYLMYRPVCERIGALCRAAGVPSTGARLFAVPVKVRGMGTFPVRAFATLRGRLPTWPRGGLQWVDVRDTAAVVVAALDRPGRRYLVPGKDVARLAGVSEKTVSNVINDYAHVSDRTRRVVRDAIEELGYKVNLAGRHLRHPLLGGRARPAEGDHVRGLDAGAGGGAGDTTASGLVVTWSAATVGAAAAKLLFRSMCLLPDAGCVSRQVPLLMTFNPPGGSFRSAKKYD